MVLRAFKGTCYICNKKGHKAHHCLGQKGARIKKSNGTCNNCGKFGLKAADCWFKEENASKRPSNGGSRSVRGTQEQASAALGTQPSVEYLLAEMEFSKDVRLLNGPSVRIADLAAHNR